MHVWHQLLGFNLKKHQHLGRAEIELKHRRAAVQRLKCRKEENIEFSSYMAATVLINFIPVKQVKAKKS